MSCCSLVKLRMFQTQVGMDGGPAPWKVTHSIYSMFLLNVKQTVAAQAFWPAKPYHDDVDFPRICEEKQLVAAKCQWLFLHKVCALTKNPALVELRRQVVYW